MLTLSRAPRQLRFWVPVLTLTGLVVGILVWQLLLTPQDNSASAQAVWEDSCDNVDVSWLESEASPAYDSLERRTFTHRAGENRTTVITTTETEITADPYYGSHEVRYDADGTAVNESFLVVRPDEGTARNTEERSDDETYSLTQYHRVKNSDGGWEDWHIQSEPIETRSGSSLARAAGDTVSANIFCGMNVDDEFTSFRYLGEEILDGTDTKHFVGTDDPLGDADDDYIKYEYWFSLTGFPVQFKVERIAKLDERQTSKLIAVTTYSGFGQQNVTNPPGPNSTPTPEPNPSPTPGPKPTPTPAPTATPTPAPTATPTSVPTATPTGAVDAWLVPDPTNITFDGQWREFTVRGTGLQDVDFSINVINYPGGPSSTGAVELEANASLPSPADACQTTYYSGYSMTIGYTFNLVGCQAGTVILRFEDPANDWALLREYTITVSGGP